MLDGLGPIVFVVHLAESLYAILARSSKALYIDLEHGRHQVNDFLVIFF